MMVIVSLVNFASLQLDTPTTPNTLARDKVKQQQTGMVTSNENKNDRYIKA